MFSKNSCDDEIYLTNMNWLKNHHKLKNLEKKFYLEFCQNCIFEQLCFLCWLKNKSKLK